ncbi:MAG TPA: calcium-translocating P-type ATPase, SERCA-type [Candidatus Norongarragalinales archaeon]|nr:calcium-translocating P-type ATPase, SERCA-type [Candidatus Norongarragalinales archaeon]
MPKESVSFHSLSAEGALKKLNSQKEGLSATEASGRLLKFGPNTLKERKKRSLLDMFIGEFKDFVILLLIAASIISAIASYFSPEPEYIDSIAIIAIVVINAIIGVYQEYKAGKAIEALRKLVTPKAKVLRMGAEIEIPTAGLVPGDIIILHEGDKVPADARLLEAHNLEIEEASLTGESEPSSKKADAVVPEKAVVNDWRNMVFMSTLVTKGEARAVVCFTGADTQIGKIADLVQTIEEEQTPLQEKLEALGKQLGKIAIAAVAMVFVVGVARAYLSVGLDFDKILSFFLIAVSLAVAAIPEGLPAVVTISLAIGVQRMAKRNSIIRRLPAAEGLGSATVICSDKTGTLTRNEMTVRRIFTNSRAYSVTGGGYDLAGDILSESGSKIDAGKEQNFQDLLHCALLCNNASLSGDGKNASIIGDPTEACLLVAGKKAGLDYLKEKKRRKKLDELTFDSTRKMMSVICDEEESGIVAYSKGAPEFVLEKSAFFMKDGRPERMDGPAKQLYLERNAEFASSGLRVLGFAMRLLKTRKRADFTIPEVESELVFLGLIAMMDPPRQEAKEAIAICKQAGIKTVMITGDNELTAKAIARELGIYEEGRNRAMTGRELEEIPDAEFSKIVQDISVYARVSPENKLKIVAGLKAKGEIVAMTGDGVNDAPAIKKSDIGVAMGITGTDVAKESADMVITDDNFASIVAAVEEGRVIFDNILKSVKYLISCNIGEVLIIFLAIMVGWDSPLLPIQILWMNLATDSLPALALAMDTKAVGIMKRKPRDPKMPVLTRNGLEKLAFIGVFMTILTLAMFWYQFETEGLAKARTAAFSLLVFFQLFIALSWHSDHDPLLKVGIFTNKYLLGAMLLGFASQILIVQTGALEAIFETVNMSAVEWVAVILISTSVLVAEEIVKYIAHRRGTADESGS